MFNREETAVSRFEELLLPFPGGVKQGLGAKTRFTPLISTGELSSGTVTANDLAANMRQRGRRPASWQPENTRFILGARIRGDAPAEVKPASAPGKDAKTAESDAPQPRGINATYICDIDMLDSQFVMLRNQPDPENNFRFDNVPFVLNVIDDLAGDKRFLEIRKRKPRHATLKQIQTHVTRIRDEETKQIQEFQKELDRQDKIVDDAVAKARTEVEKIVAESNQARDRGELDAAKVREFQDRITIARLKLSSEERAAEIQKKRHQDKFNRDQMAAKQDIDRQISSIQNQYKLFSAAIFPLPPLLVGIAVFVYRRIREREGISKSRMRQ
jgi:ABC-2 type transport system permease protein